MSFQTNSVCGRNTSTHLTWVTARFAFGLTLISTSIALLALQANRVLPDRGAIAFLSVHEGNWAIYVLDTRVWLTLNLTRNPTDDWFPAWSADGRQLLFQSYRDGSAELYIMDADGSSVRRLTKHL